MTNGDARNAADELTYQPTPASRRDRMWTLATWGLLLVAALALRVISGEWERAVIPGLGAVAGVVMARRQSRLTYRADASGIRSPHHLRSPWSEIESVKLPTQWDTAVMVRMASGEERSTGFPLQDAQRLADLGHKPLR